MPTREPDNSKRNATSSDQRPAGAEERNAGHYERPIDTFHDEKSAVEKSNALGEEEHSILNEAPAPGAEENDQGPYNRGSQFEATETNGDSPSTQISLGAHKRSQKEWQVEAGNPDSRVTEKE